jgi:hypothetical protein
MKQKFQQTADGCIIYELGILCAVKIEVMDRSFLFMMVLVAKKKADENRELTWVSP